jgi:hypothetical protein
VENDDATLNFFYSDGTTVHASGLVVKAHAQFDADFKDKRIEGQFIFANSEGVTSVILHAFDGLTFCETRGTAQFAVILPPSQRNRP